MSKIFETVKLKSHQILLLDITCTDCVGKAENGGNGQRCIITVVREQLSSLARNSRIVAYKVFLVELPSLLDWNFCSGGVSPLVFP